MKKYVISLEGAGSLLDRIGADFLPQEYPTGQKSGFFATRWLWAKSHDDAAERTLVLVARELDRMGLGPATCPERKVWVTKTGPARIFTGWRFWSNGAGFTWYPEGTD